MGRCEEALRGSIPKKPEEARRSPPWKQESEEAFHAAGLPRQSEEAFLHAGLLDPLQLAPRLALWLAACLVAWLALRLVLRLAARLHVPGATRGGHACTWPLARWWVADTVSSPVSR